MSLLNLEIAVVPRFHFDQVLDKSFRPAKVEFPIPQDLIRRKTWCAVVGPGGGFPVGNGVGGYLEFTYGGVSRGLMKFDYTDSQQVLLGHDSTSGGPDSLVLNVGAPVPYYLSPVFFTTQADKASFRLDGPLSALPTYYLFLAVLSEYPL